MSRTMTLIVVGSLLCGAARAQVAPVPPNLTQTLLTDQLPALSSVISMAVDVEGNVYVLDDQPGGDSALWALHRIRPDGTVDQDHAMGTGSAPQVAYHPGEGRVYMIHAPGSQGPGSSDISRVASSGGTVLAATIAFTASGFTIDDAGRPVVVGAGQLYRLVDVSSSTLTLLAANPGLYGRLLALGTTDVLLQQGGNVLRWNAGVGDGNPIPWDTLNINPLHMSGHGLARNPFNRFGIGGIFLRRVGAPTAVIHQVQGISRSTSGAEPTLIVSFAYLGGTPAPVYVGQIAGGQRRDLYWLSGLRGGTLRLWRIHEDAQADAPGSLVITSAPGTLTLEVFGPAGAPFNLGVTTDPPGPGAHPLLIPIGGVLDLDPFHAGYLPLADGIGAFAPPDPMAAIGPSGCARLAFQLSPLPYPLHFLAQHLSFTQRAPNGLFQISDVVAFTVN